MLVDKAIIGKASIVENLEELKYWHIIEKD